MSDGLVSARPVSIGTAPHYTWGAGCDGWHLVNRRELSVIRERMPPGSAEARHSHAASRQFFYILSGSAILELEGGEFTLSAGEGLEVAPGSPHQVFNRSAAWLEFLVVSQPHSHGDRIPAAT